MNTGLINDDPAIFKDSLAEIAAGDSVVVNTSNGRLYMLKVSRVTATQIVIGEQRFRREDGKELGSGASYYSDFAYAPLSKDAGGRTWLHQYNRYAQDQAELKKKQPYVNYLLNELRSRTLSGLPLEDLREAARRLGYAQDVQ